MSPTPMRVRARSLSRSARVGTAILGLAAAWPAALGAQTPTLVKDIRSGSVAASSSPINSVRVGSKIYFGAFDSISGRELWVTDGTSAGTQMLKDIYPGGSSSSPSEFTAIGSTVYFRAFKGGTGSIGTELWKTDGTAAGTVLVKDIRAGSLSSSPRNLTAVGSTLFFTAFDSASGTELYKSNGTSAGTVLVKDIRTGTPSSSPRRLIAMGGNLYFVALTSTTGYELYKSNGTAAGTAIVKELRTGSSSSMSSSSGDSARMAAIGSTLYFVGSAAATGYELYKTDGTALGTVLVKDVRTGPSSGISSSSHWLTVMGSSLYFTGNAGTTGTELWKSNGTTAGTALVKDVRSGSLSSSPRQLQVVGTRLYFVAFESATGTELYKSDGTAATTGLVKDIRTGSSSGISVSSFTRYPMASAVGNVFFVANDGFSTGQHGYELWKSNGTAAGTMMVKDLRTGTSSGVSTFKHGYINAIGPQVIFSANDGNTGTELYRSIGTAATTTLLKNIRPELPASSSPFAITDGHGTTFFRASNGFSTGQNGTELWKTDGTTAGTVMVKDIRTGTSSSFPSNFVNVDGKIYFTASTATTGTELMKTDGTSAGTVVVKDIRAGRSSSSPFNLTDFNGTLMFRAFGSTGGAELYKSDGTATGTVLVKDIRTGSFSSFPSNFRVVNKTMFFTANNGTNGTELWKTDGTGTGTTLVKDIRTGTLSSFPFDLVNYQNTLYFTASNGTSTGQHGSELWKSDGTAAGTTMVLDIYNSPTNGSSTPRNKVVVGNTLYFSAFQPAGVGASGRELWRSNGTAAGTSLVKDIRPGSSSGLSTSTSAFGVIGSTIYFPASNGTNGFELWKSDGTSASTVMVKDIRPGTSSSISTFGGSNNITALGKHIWFTADDGVKGDELWKTDGTNAGTVLVSDIWAGAGQSFPDNFMLSRGDLYFTANNSAPGGSGNELYRVFPGASVKDFGHGCATEAKIPTMSGDIPAINTTFTVTGSNAAGHVGLVLGGFGQPSPTPVAVFGSGCVLNVLTSVIFDAVIPNAAGDWLKAYPIPNDTGLVGARIHGQTLLLPITGTLHFDFSNGIKVNIGN